MPLDCSVVRGSVDILAIAYSQESGFELLNYCSLESILGRRRLIHACAPVFASLQL